MCDITEITDYEGHANTDDVTSFIDYWDMVDDKMVELFGIDTMDTGIEADDIANLQEDGWNPLQVAEWIGEKYNLDRKAVFA